MFLEVNEEVRRDCTVVRVGYLPGFLASKLRWVAQQAQGQSRLWQRGGTIATEGDRSPLVTNFNKVWRLSQANHLPRLARSVSSANSRVDPNRPLTLQYCPRRYDYRCWPTLLHVLTHHSGQLLFRLGYRVYLAQFCIVAEFLKRGTLWHPGTPTDLLFFARRE